MATQRSGLFLVLAAGEGTRMRSNRPKALHEIAGRSMLGHVLEAGLAAGLGSVAVVVGPGREDVAAEVLKFAPNADVFVQSERLGTAHAVLAARAAITRGHDDVVVAYADLPLLEASTLAGLRTQLAEGAGVCCLGFRPADPAGYGRLVQREGEFVEIREHKDCNAADLKIGLCNAGPMAVRGDRALEWLDAVGRDNAQREYYLTDLVAVARSRGAAARILVASPEEAMGVNDRVQLAAAEAVAQRRLRERAMRAGATLIAPETVFFSTDTELGRDVLIEPNVVFGRGVKVEDEAIIHAFSHLEGAVVAKGASVGPYGRLRPGAKLGPGAKVGNFVEIKNATLGRGAKVSHLTYVGDAEIGANANLGAGTITCNYDGFSKFKTKIGEGAFIGSNSALVAPVSIGDGAYVGSGSVVTKDVPADALAVGRGRQVNIEGWAAKFRANERPGKKHD